MRVGSNTRPPNLGWPASAAALAWIAVALAGCAGDIRGAEKGDGYDFDRDFPACMAELGWESATDPEGGVTTRIPEGQKEAYEAARDQCHELIGANDRPPLTTEQLREVYVAQAANRECLVRLGYPLPDAPTEQAFLDMKGMWTPYMDLPEEARSNDWEDVVEACPQVTADALRED